MIGFLGFIYISQAHQEKKLNAPYFGFTETAKQDESIGFAIKNEAQIHLGDFSYAEFKILKICFYRTSSKLLCSCIRVFVNGEFLGTLNSGKIGFSKKTFKISKFCQQKRFSISLKFLPKRFSSFIRKPFCGKHINKTQKSPARDVLVIQRIEIDDLSVLDYTKKKKFFSDFSIRSPQRPVFLYGFFKQIFGIAEAAKRTSHALKVTNLEIHDVQLPFKGKHLGFDDSVNIQSELRSNQNEAFKIFHFNGDFFEEFSEGFGEDAFNSFYSIGFWHWELKEFPDDFFHWFHRVNEVWVPSLFVRDAIAPKSPVPVQVFPLCIENSFYKYRPEDRKSLGLPQNDFIFLVIFDYFSSMQRKNPIATIVAFGDLLEKITSGRKIHLVVKTSNSHADSKSAAILTSALKILPEGTYTHMDKVFEREKMLKLINSCDSVVSLHRAEGFGLHLAEAMAFGKLVIATNWSGNLDFMNSENSFLVNYELVEIQEDHNNYKKGYHWANPCRDHAVAQMQNAYNSSKWQNSPITKNAIKTTQTYLSSSSIGQKMFRRIRVIEEHRRLEMLTKAANQK